MPRLLNAIPAVAGRGRRSNPDLGQITDGGIVDRRQDSRFVTGACWQCDQRQPCAGDHTALIQGETFMKDLVQAFIKDESGATMVEYAILVALIAVAVIATVILLRIEIQAAFQKVADELSAATGSGGGEETP
jgi:pilus assembly protein Flp/PilA